MKQINDSKQRFPLLVVDDSPVAHKLVENALPAEQSSVLAAKTGREALHLFALQRPGLVITDWLMPDLSGIELCQHLRDRFKDSFTYIILLTSLSEKSNVVKGLQAADDYLTKPFDASELLARVNVGRRFVELHREIEAKNRFLEQLALTETRTWPDCSAANPALSLSLGGTCALLAGPASPRGFAGLAARWRHSHCIGALWNLEMENTVHVIRPDVQQNNVAADDDVPATTILRWRR